METCDAPRLSAVGPASRNGWSMRCAVSTHASSDDLFGCWKGNFLSRVGRVVFLQKRLEFVGQGRTEIDA